MDDSIQDVVVNQVSVNFGTLISRNFDLNKSLGISAGMHSPL
jgi:hypothetical protein